MTSRERILTALDHRKPDRVPIDFGGSRVSGIAAIAYRNLVQHLGREERIRLYDIKQQLAYPSLETVRQLGGDVVQLTRLAPTTAMPFLMIDRWAEGTMTDGAPCLVPEGYDPVELSDGTREIRREGRTIARLPAGGLYFDAVETPLKDADSLDDIEAFEFSDNWSERETAFLESQVELYFNGSDMAIFGGLPLFDCSFFEMGQYHFGFENLLMNFMLKREMMECWLDKLLAHHLAVAREFLAVAGRYLCAIQLNDDFGTQESLLIPPDVYRELIKPRQAAWIEFVRERTDAKIFLHCDGAVSEILDDFVEIGIEVLNPVQTGAKDMEPERLKKRYGRNLAFWGGGVDTQTTLPFGSIDDIRAEVRDRIKTLGKSGGYVFGTIHNIQSDIPPEKVCAVFEAAREYGQYPKK